MKRRLLFILAILLSASIMPISQSIAQEVIDNNNVTIQLSHENQSKKPSEFVIYAITEQEYQKALEMKLERSVEKTKRWLKEKEIPKLSEVLVMQSASIKFVLPRYNEAKERLYYVLLQKNPDREGIKGEEIYQVFPSFISFDNVEDDFLVIETKRVFMSQTGYFFKYGSGEIEKPLKNAEFAFYQLNEKNEKEYLMSIDPIEWQTNVKAEEAWQFKSESNGLVALPDLGLDVGTYFFEETKAPTGYQKTEASRKIPLVITETDEGLVMMINGKQLVPMQAGELPEEILIKGEPRVLNDSETEPPGELKPPIKETPNEIKPKKETPSSGFLPKTGESKWAFSSLGLALIIIGIIYKKRGKENE